MNRQWIAALAVAYALASACSSKDANTPVGGQTGAGSGGTSGAGGTIADAMSGGASGTGGGSGGSGLGGNGGSEAGSGGTSSATDAMVEDDVREPGGRDAGAPAPFQSIEWPSADAVVEVDMTGAFGTDVSGATYRAGTLWLSMNLAPAKLYKMQKSGASWQRVMSDGWDDGKELLFPDGSGIPDAEGVTLATNDSDILYVGSERNLQAADALTSRSSVLSYDPALAGAGDTLTALREWNLAPSLPAVGANQGLEAVTWIPDGQLGFFFDPATEERYEPDDYPTHGKGLFVVGLESQSDLYFFALGSDGSVDLIATIATELAGIMGLEYDASVGYLWAYCDNTCGNRAEILSMLPSGEFARRASVAAPASLPDINNEGIAVAPDSECSRGVKPFYWVEDGNTDGHVLRAGTIPCGAFLERL